jgi:putative acetyltransferase
MHIRPERRTDIPGIRAVNLAAFGTSVEADLVEALRQQADPIISLVAEDGGALVGHILFSPVTLIAHPELRAIGLAPMAVVPARQRQGIGSALVHDGLRRCRTLGFGVAVVLGHAEYYPRFGFTPASHFDLRSEYDVPEEIFMVLEFEQGTLKGKSGTIRYHPAFASV